MIIPPRLKLYQERRHLLLAECTNKDLKIARETRKMPRWQLGELVGISESTVERWETGETQPQPDDIDNIGVALGDETLWHRWMLSHYDSYRKRYIKENGSCSLLGSIMAIKFEMQDVLALQEQVERDSMDGKIDDPELWARYAQELKEASAAIASGLQRLIE